MIAQLPAVRHFPGDITRRGPTWDRVDPCAEKTELRVWGHEGNKTSQETEPEARKPEREKPRGLPWGRPEKSPET